MSVNGKMTIDTSQFCRQPSKMVHEAQVGPIVILRRDKPVACLVSYDYWVEMTQCRHEGDDAIAAPAENPDLDQA